MCGHLPFTSRQPCVPFLNLALCEQAPHSKVSRVEDRLLSIGPFQLQLLYLELEANHLTVMRCFDQSHVVVC